MSCIFSICLAAATISVTDGDTIRSGDLRIRIWGIDAPETNTDAGPAATAAMHSLVRAAEMFDCENMDTDRYGRTVARCTIRGGDLDGLDVACGMVGIGHAKDWPRYSGGYYAPCKP